MMKARQKKGARRLRAGWLKSIGLSALLAVGAIWLAVLHEHPVDDAVLQGMSDPRCAAVRRMPAGALLSVPPPRDDRCLSFYLYRAVSTHTADDEHAYVTAVMQARVSHFWRLFAPTLALWAVSVGLSASGFWFASRVLGRWRRAPRLARRPHRGGPIGHQRSVEQAPPWPRASDRPDPAVIDRYRP